jgi:cystathionine beta-lyase/cystathionine gamma-synthase
LTVRQGPSDDTAMIQPSQDHSRVRESAQLETLLVNAPPVPPLETNHETPIYETAGFAVNSLDDFDSAAAEHDRVYFYSRYANPTICTLEAQVARLEGADAALSFASGMGAIATTLLSLLSAGDHVVVTDDLFVTTRELLNLELPRFGIDVTTVDPLDTDAFAAAISDRTRVVFAEVISNPLLKVLDLTAVRDIAHEHGVLLVVDNTFVSPVLLRPLELGADLVIHSATKFLSGHGTVLGGIVAGSAPLVDLIAARRGRLGTSLSAHAAHAIRLGLKTLSLRVRSQCHTALQVAQTLDSHPAVSTVYYPGLAEHPRHDLAKDLTQGLFGSIVTFALRDHEANKRAVYDSLQLIRRATSLGDVVTLANPWKEHGVIRLSIGIENPRDLIADLTQALDAARS